MSGQRSWPARIAVLALAGAVAGCAARNLPPAAVPEPTADAVTVTTRVPQVVDGGVKVLDKEFSKAGLVPLVKYEPGLLLERGVVAVTDPPGGTSLPRGSVVRVVVAGEPATLDEYIRGHWETFVGTGIDAKGTVVLGVHEGNGLPGVVEGVEKYVKGKPYRLVTCPNSRVDLEKVVVELSERRFLPTASALKFSLSIDGYACAVQMRADLNDEETAQLMEKFGAKLVIERGPVEGRLRGDG
ncbi:hypothetical protein Cme02nite_13150 [Catellatospora methionotrophica]|uniref:PASTA domain-containing protein n=1 Tax=Catellatospora methionotrophica TaxID=121620 RepID=A0A8J3L244_9ACTN|nr:hypothetical protein [Catellatospora methionotrophica]GIG12983.1 hypothetical protein Cme02nite_13150 [Catellatospora methionotrophica]